MPSKKEWGTTVPNLDNFVRVVPVSAAKLLEKLESMKNNWWHVANIGVVKIHKAVVVDLGRIANAQKDKETGEYLYLDFYVPLKTEAVDKADTIVKGLIAKGDEGKPLVEQEAIDLYACVDTSAP
jgi:hypothetical protein